MSISSLLSGRGDWDRPLVDMVRLVTCEGGNKPVSQRTSGRDGCDNSHPLIPLQILVRSIFHHSLCLQLFYLDSSDGQADCHLCLQFVGLKPTILQI